MENSYWEERFEKRCMQTIKPLNLKLNLIKGTLSIKVSIKQQKYKIFNVYYN